MAAQKIKADETWTFPGREGNPAHQNTVTYQWNRARDKAKVSDIRLHDCRHFFASGLIADGYDVVTVQRALDTRRRRQRSTRTRTLGRPPRTAPAQPGRRRIRKCSEVLTGNWRTATRPRRLSCGNAPVYTLKRNSTTSPSAIT
jgi:integrase